GSNTFTGTSESYHDQYADSKKWVEEGWLHYICPQVYWSFQHSSAPYADVVDWWASVVRGTDVDLIIGHGIHNVNSWLSDEIQTQLRYNQKHPEIKGSAFYSASYLVEDEINALALTHWTTTPLNIWPESSVTAPTVELTGTLSGTAYSSDVTATMTSEHTIYYRINNGEWVLYENPITLTAEGVYSLHVKAVTAASLESLIEGYTIEIDKVNSDLPVITINGNQIGTAYEIGSTISLSSGGNPIWVAINHGNVGEWQLYTEPIVLDDIGNYYIRAKTINSENVESAEVNRLITVDADCFDNPEIDVLGTGTHPYYREVTVSINGQTDVSYRINEGDWTTYTETLSFPNEGTYVIEYKNNDFCGVTLSETIIVDKTAPSDPVIDVTGSFDGRYYTEPSIILLAKVDVDDVIYYRLHNGKSWTAWSIYNESIGISKNANYTIEYYASDQAGNTSETASKLIRLNIPISEHNEYVERDGEYVTYYNTDIPVQLPTDYVEKEAEVRAAWVATVANIDIGVHTSEDQYKLAIQSMLNRLEALHFNTMFFQVRPMNDAFYPSDYAPFSRYLTGEEGVDPGWDMFEYLIHEAHIRGIEVHAWLNPYRVSNTSGDKADQLALLHEDNFAKQHPEYVLQDLQGKLILNPGEEAVRTYIKNVIDEIMTNYDVDGIHFDDYFYSYNGMDNAQDAATYEDTKLTDQTLADWRRENVNMLVHDIFDMVELHNTTNQKMVKFGISPFGIWKSQGIDGSNTSTSTMQSYSAQYADTKKWVEEGWLHYIMPQLYWPFDHSLAPYADLVDWWAELCAENEVDLIIGHGFYRYAESNGWTNESEFLEQLRYNQKYDIIKGSALFSYKTLNNTNTLVTAALGRLSEHYWTDYVTFPWVSDVEPYEPLVCLPNQTEVNGICVDNQPTCVDGQEWNGEACV
ncbi:MAG: family 10 glycosylhydrolase, partial [Acholeplasmataceae bacterium]|nr:family 10 glycosylhydrolase [Acholeplasmataceae bacterium]